MPGHSMAAIASYPELTCQPGNYHVGNTWGVYDTILCPTPYTFNFYQNVLTEVMELFPSHYIHIGGDEAPKVTWNNSAYCRALMKKLHLKDADELQSYFINTMEKFLNAHGRDIIGWDEILQGGLAPNATVMSWRGEAGGIAAAKMHHDVIMSPTTYLYFDYYQSRAHDSLFIGGYLPLEKVYGYNPLPPELDSTEDTYIKGVQANMWTEYIATPSKLEYQLFPRMEAAAEIAWTPQSERSYPDFVKRVETQFKRYDLWKVSYSRAMYELQGAPGARADHDGVDVSLKAPGVPGKIHYTTNGGAPGAHSAVYDSPVHLTASARIRAALFHDGTKVGPELRLDLDINKATGRQVTLSEPPAQKYSAGGAFTLVDGVAPDDASSGEGWLGFNGSDMDAKIDLGSEVEVSRVRVDYGDAAGRWIYPPRSVEVLFSADGVHYQPAGALQPVASDSVHTATLELGKVKTRYLQVKALNHGVIPAGNPGAGSKSWLFVGEISVE
jgi:hexosaminidase